jgi:hypothetical protein
MTQNPADPSAYRVKIARNAHGVADGITILDAGGGVLLDSEDDVFARLIAKAREEDGADPHDDKLPSDRAFILAALRDLGIPIQGEDDEDDGAASEARIQNAMAFGLEPPEEPPHHDPQDEEAPWDRREREAQERAWRDVPVLVQVDGAEDRLVLAGAFADANAAEPGLVPTLAELVRGDVDWCRFGGGAAPMVQVVRAFETPGFDYEVLAAIQRTMAKADAYDALMQARATQPMEDALVPGPRPDPLPELIEAARAALECIEKHVPATTFAPRARLRAAIAAAEGAR